jgi:hypothetical protein
LEFICREFGTYLSSLKYGHRHEESPEHLTFGGGWINGIVQALESYLTCLEHDKKFQELLHRQVQSNELQSDDSIGLSEILKRAVQPRAVGNFHTCDIIGEDSLATGLDKLLNLSVNG